MSLPEVKYYGNYKKINKQRKNEKTLLLFSKCKNRKRRKHSTLKNQSWPFEYALLMHYDNDNPINY